MGKGKIYVRIGQATNLQDGKENYIKVGGKTMTLDGTEDTHFGQTEVAPSDADNHNFNKEFVFNFETAMFSSEKIFFYIMDDDRFSSDDEEGL